MFSLMTTTTNGYVPQYSTLGPIPSTSFTKVTRLSQVIVIVVAKSSVDRFVEFLVVFEVELVVEHHLVSFEHHHEFVDCSFPSCSISSFCSFNCFGLCAFERVVL
ncbi:hypothetical protein Lalb_Chr21g0318421 [Lupinus albus]|uniref:Uncharacterized protein n=1 Tax=Lupinus albus TaxID=3870 RepID=A0A6A4N8V2_LUPAL|nr:hypothetical protein Lalb_Chr21g0318421 [Lupinus albus]